MDRFECQGCHQIVTSDADVEDHKNRHGLIINIGPVTEVAKLVIEIPVDHLPFVRQQLQLHGNTVRLDFPQFKALIPGHVVGRVSLKYDALLPYLTGEAL